MKGHASRVAIAAGVVLMTVMPGLSHGEQVDGCYNRVTGNLRVLTPHRPACGRFEEPISWNAPPASPPVIVRTLTCDDAFQLTLGLEIFDDQEVAFFAIQKQGTDPALNYLYSVEPGAQLVDYEITIGVGPSDEAYLIIASDMEGNVAKELFAVPADFCSSP
jgi:hypothetical protein